MSFSFRKMLWSCCCVSLLMVLAYMPARAQESGFEPEQSIQGQEQGASSNDKEVISSAEVSEEDLPSGQPTLDDMLKRLELNAPDVDVFQISSLFFSAREHSLLAEARQGFVTRPPGEGELQSADNGNVEIGPRTLSLGGIVYVDSNDWVVWLNGQRISVNAIPSEVLDINVTKHYVKLQWFDEYTNQIFPVKLRAHQRFNIDTRIFLPG